MKPIEFRQADHVYLVNGRVVPSVTQVLKASGLMGWVPRSTRARDLGTLVHCVAADYDRTGRVRLVGKAEVDGRVAAWAHWAEVAGYRAERVEDLLARELPTGWTAGTVDTAGTLGGQKAIVDRKSGVPAAWHRYQVAGYAALLGPEWLTARRLCVYLKADARVRVVEYPAGDEEAIARFIEGRGKWVEWDAEVGDEWD